MEQWLHVYYTRSVSSDIVFKAQLPTFGDLLQQSSSLVCRPSTWYLRLSSGLIHLMDCPGYLAKTTMDRHVFSILGWLQWLFANICYSANSMVMKSTLADQWQSWREKSTVQKPPALNRRLLRWKARISLVPQEMDQKWSKPKGKGFGNHETRLLYPPSTKLRLAQQSERLALVVGSGDCRRNLPLSLSFSLC